MGLRGCLLEVVDADEANSKTRMKKGKDSE